MSTHLIFMNEVIFKEIYSNCNWIPNSRFLKLHYSSSRVLFKPIWELNLNSWKKEIFQNEPNRIEPKRNENNWGTRSANFNLKFGNLTFYWKCIEINVFKSNLKCWKYKTHWNREQTFTQKLRYGLS